MPRTGERGGPQTRARISQVATALFLERGFDDVTVAEVARVAGVSSVTVFKHFPRKEDLLLDRTPEAAEMLRAAVRSRGAGPVMPTVLDALEELTSRLADERHSLSGLTDGAAPFFAAVAGSPSLASRAREIAGELVGVLAESLVEEGVARSDADLAAALVIAGYSSALVATARAVVERDPVAEVVAAHRERVGRLFAVLRTGLVA